MATSTNLIKLEMQKRLGIQASLILSVESKVHLKLTQFCEECKVDEDMTQLLDHTCMRPELYKAFVWGIFSNHSELMALKNDCEHWFKKYCEKIDLDALMSQQKSPFNGWFLHLVKNKTLLTYLEDITNKHSKSEAPLSTDIMKIYYLLSNEYMCEKDALLDLPDFP